jgi:DNA-binding NarL/FixJ family response regulator
MPQPFDYRKVGPDYPGAVEAFPGARDVPQRILIVDDHDAVRDVLRAFLEQTGYVVCGEAVDGLEAIEKAKELKPNLIVLDLSMPRLNGAEAASIIGRLMPDMPIVLLNDVRRCIGEISGARAVGAKAVVPKADGMNKLIECVRNLLGPA